MLLAVEGFGGLALEHHVEDFQGLDLAGGLRVGHLGHHSRILEDLCMSRARD